MAVVVDVEPMLRLLDCILVVKYGKISSEVFKLQKVTRPVVSVLTDADRKLKMGALVKPNVSLRLWSYREVSALAKNSKKEKS